MNTSMAAAAGTMPPSPGTAASDEVLRLVDVHKTYGDRDAAVAALDGVTLTVTRGSFIAVMGPSGSGKTTLLQCAAGLDRPSSGKVLIDGADLADMSETARTKFRRGRIGFIFQQLNLLPTLTVLENVALPLRMTGRRVDDGRCRDIVERVGIADRVDHRPGQLSGGQQQRAAIARALVTGPSIIFADEPTGALDSTSAAVVLNLLRESVDQFDQTLVMVTHDPQAAAYADTVIFLRDGRLVDELHDPTADTVAERMTTLTSVGRATTPQQGA